MRLLKQKVILLILFYVISSKYFLINYLHFEYINFFIIVIYVIINFKYDYKYDKNNINLKI